MKRFALIIILISVSISIFANYELPGKTGFYNPNFQLGSLLNPDKIKMSHSMSFGSGISSNGSGFYQSAYTNHMKFDLKENLKMNIDLSFVNQGTMTHQNDLNFKSNNDSNNLVIPSFSLEYQPFENTKLYFEYRQYNGLPFQSSRKYDYWR